MSVSPPRGCAGDQLQRDVPFGPVGWGGLDSAGGAIGREQAVAHAPEPARASGAVPVAAGVRELAAAAGVDAFAALGWGGAGQQHVVAAARAATGEHATQPLDGFTQPDTALVEDPAGRAAP